MVVSDAIHNIMGGMESTAGVRLHNHRRKLKQRFDIIKKLGQGTYGKVQLGINKETGQEVAIKTIKKSKIETEADLVRIRREIQIMSSVQHPNIIHIYEVFENREKMVLVMEYAAGGELYDYLSERKVLDEAEARRIFRQISTAVYYCHKHKICHRDLKLENILLDEHGSAKIADFGLSNVFDEQRLLGTFCGSPLYASPEIVKGTPYHGPEVDCWSLGVLLYTLVYGAMPFDGSNFKRLVKQISQGDYFEPKKPSPASSLIRDMLNVNPTSRANIEKICSHWWVNESYSQSCAEIAEELANQTPVRLDLLLSLAPPPASADALLVNKDQETTTPVIGPARSQSVGSLMELDHPRVSFDAEKRRLSEAGATKDSPPKRKLEQGPSTDEANQGGAKRKERGRHREREHSSERRQHRSTSRSKGERQSSSKKAPTPDPSQVPLPDEAGVPENASGTCSESMDVDMDASAVAKECEDLTKKAEETENTEVLEEAAKRPAAESISKVPELAGEEAKSSEEAKKVKVKRKKKTSDLKLSESKEEGVKVDETVPKSEDVGEVKNSSQKEEVTSKDEPIPTTVESSADVTAEGDKPKEVPQEAQEVKPETNGETKEKKVVKKVSVKKKSDLSPSKIAQANDKPSAQEEAQPPSKPMVRRRSKIFESEIQKFNNMSATAEVKPAIEKPKKVFIPGVKVSDFKKAYERKSSVELVAPPLVPSAAKAAPVKKAVTGVEGDIVQTTENETSTTIPEANNETIESNSKADNVAPCTEKILKPEELSNQNSSEKTEKEKADDISTTKESQKVASGKVESSPVVSKEEAKPEPSPEKPLTKEELVKKQKAVAIIGNAITKPPKPSLDKLKLRNTSLKSPPESPKKPVDEEAVKSVTDPLSPTGKKVVKVQVGPNDVRNATLQVSTPEQIQNFTYNEAAKTEAVTEDVPPKNVEEKEPEKPADGKKSSKVEIVLKSATLPRRKTSKAEIQLGMPKTVPERPAEYRTEVEHMVGTPNNKMQNQRSEVAFPVAAAAQPTRSVSVEPEGAPKGKPKERIIPIQFERSPEERAAVPSPPPAKPPVPPLSQQRSMSQRSSSLSRQSTLESETESTEPIRKSPREFIIPIAVEGGGYVTPRAGSLEPESTSESTHKPRKPHRFPRTMRMGSLLSDGGLSEDEGFNSISSPFASLNRQREGEADDDRGLHHMHRLRSSRPSRRPTVERAESLSSGEEEEDDDDDGFELLTAESLFSTLLSRVRNLTQRLNVDDTRHGFPTSRFMNMNHNFPSHSPFWSNMEPLSRRVSETSQFSRPSRDESGSSWRRSASRDTDCDSQYSDATNSNAASSLPRGSSRHDFDEMSEASNSSYPSYYTPSLARRIQRTNQELRNRSSTNLDSSYGHLPPRDYTTLPSRRPMSRTSSVKSEDGSRRPAHFLPVRSPSCLDSSRKTDKIRSFERSGSVERYLPQVGNGDGGHLRGLAAAQGNDGGPSRRSASYLGSRGCLGSSDSLNYVGYGRDRVNRNSDIDGNAAKNFLPPTRRNINSLDNGYGDSLPRRRMYRSSMSDSVENARKKSDDYHRSHSSIVEETNNYNHETLPPLPQSSNYGRKREGGVQKSASYLRQRALDIANIYGGPLGEPTRLDRDYAQDVSDTMSVSRSGFEDRIASRYGEGEQRGRSQIPKVSRLRSSSLNRESDQLHGESIREAILRRQKSYDKLDQTHDKPKLQRPLSLSLQQPSESSVLSKFFDDSRNEGTQENSDTNSLNPGENPTSPARSPGRKVSRFLRPDFYDTPREESMFAKEKEDALKSAKEIEEPKEQREPEQFYKDLSEKLASKLQLLSEMGITQSDPPSQNMGIVTKQDTGMQNSSEVQLRDSKETKLADNSLTTTHNISNSIGTPTESVGVVPVEPRVAKVFKPKVLKKDGVSLSPKPFESTVECQETSVAKDHKNKLTKELTKPFDDLLKSPEMALISKDSEFKLTTKDPSAVKPKPISKDSVKVSTSPVPKLPSLVQKVSTSPIPKVSTSPIPKVSTSPIPKVSTSPIPKVSTSPVPKVSTSPIPKVSTSPVPKVSTSPIPKVSTSPVPKVSTSPIPKVSTSSVPKVSTSPIPKVSTSPVPKVSTSPIPKILPSPIPKVPTPPVPKVQTPPVPKVSTSPVPKVSTSPVSKDTKDVLSKIPLPKENSPIVKGADVNVSANIVLNGHESVNNASLSTEEKTTKVVEIGTPKVKVRKKIKKTPASDATIKPSDAKAGKSANSIVNPVDSIELSEESKTEKSPKLDCGNVNGNAAEVKTSSGTSRIEKMIRTLRERSLTPKGTEDILTVSNLLKRAVSVDNCSTEPSVPKSTNKIKKVIKSLKELTSSPKANIDTESSLLKRAVSVGDCSIPVQTKSKVNSVLGIFRKMEEPKAEAKAEKKASLLSRFRKTQSLYAGSASDGVVVQDTDSAEEKEKPNSASARRFGFKGAKGNRISSSFEIESTVDDDTSNVGRICNGVGISDSNVSCSVKIKLPEQEISKNNKQNGIHVENDKDVSISTTIKLIKDTAKENVPKSKQSSEVEDAFTIKKTPNVPRANAENGMKNGIAHEDVNSKSRNNSRIPQMTTSKGPTCDGNTVMMDERRGPRVDVDDDDELSSNRTRRSKDTDPCSSASLPSEEDLESIDDTSSVCSDWEFRTSPLPPYQHRAVVPDPDELESMQERIRRKSFFSRFNDMKKKPVAYRRTSTSAVPSLREVDQVRRDGRPEEI